MLRVGIIAEGKSEWLVLEAVMRATCPNSEIEFERLRPDLTLASMSPHGWRGVRAWCQEFGGKLDAFMRGVKGREIDLLVIHADCSMAHNENAAHPCPPASATANALRTVIVEQWLGLTTQPPFVVVTTPSKSTDAWVVAALQPPYKGFANIECDFTVENELVARKKLRKKDGEVKKPELKYQPLAQDVAKHLGVVVASCAQADRFVQEFKAAATQAILAP